MNAIHSKMFEFRMLGVHFDYAESEVFFVLGQCYAIIKYFLSRSSKSSSLFLTQTINYEF